MRLTRLLGAGHMAEGYARASGKPGVVLVTSGPGATNVITPIQDALSDGTPLVVFCGQVPTSAIGSDAFQEADVVGISRGKTSVSKQPSPIPKPSPSSSIKVHRVRLLLSPRMNFQILTAWSRKLVPNGIRWSKPLLSCPKRCRKRSR